MAEHAASARTQRIGSLFSTGLSRSTSFGFVEAFSIARFLGTDYSSPPPYPFEIVLIAKEIAKVKSANGPSVAPDWDFAEALKQPLDLLMVPGGGGTWPLLDETSDPNPVARLLEWMNAMDMKVRIMASVCTGAAVLAKCGILDALAAATNHSAFGWVVKHGPLVLWDNVARWVDAGKYVTSAGVSSGTDLGFYLVLRLAGRAVAETAAIAAEYDWHRDPQAPIHYPQRSGGAVRNERARFAEPNLLVTKNSKNER
jgi:transcriptional regulator GlxA family with amidase domain